MPPTEQEIAELYERYAHVVFHRALRILGTEEAAQDAVQETFARVILHWERFRGDASPLTWMYRITTNYALNQVRNRRGREQKRVVHRADILAEEAAWLKPLNEAETIRKILADEDETTQRIVIYTYFDEMTRAQVAAEVGLSVPTVRKRLNHFLKKTRRRLNTTRVPAMVLMLLGVS